MSDDFGHRRLAQQQSVMNMCLYGGHLVYVLIGKERTRVKMGKLPKCLWPQKCYFPPKRTGLDLKDTSLDLKGTGTGSLPSRLTLALPTPPWEAKAQGTFVPRLCASFRAFFTTASGSRFLSPRLAGSRAARRRGPGAAGSALLPSSASSSLSQAFLKGQAVRNQRAPWPRFGNKRQVLISKIFIHCLWHFVPITCLSSGHGVVCKTVYTPFTALTLNCD